MLSYIYWRLCFRSSKFSLAGNFIAVDEGTLVNWAQSLQTFAKAFVLIKI